MNPFHKSSTRILRKEPNSIHTLTLISKKFIPNWMRHIIPSQMLIRFYNRFIILAKRSLLLLHQQVVMVVLVPLPKLLRVLIIPCMWSCFSWVFPSCYASIECAIVVAKKQKSTSSPRDSLNYNMSLPNIFVSTNLNLSQNH